MTPGYPDWTSASRSISRLRTWWIFVTRSLLSLSLKMTGEETPQTLHNLPTKSREAGLTAPESLHSKSPARDCMKIFQTWYVKVILLSWRHPHSLGIHGVHYGRSHSLGRRHCHGRSSWPQPLDGRTDGDSPTSTDVTSSTHHHIRRSTSSCRSYHTTSGGHHPHTSRRYIWSDHLTSPPHAHPPSSGHHCTTNPLLRLLLLTKRNIFLDYLYFRLHSGYTDALG